MGGSVSQVFRSGSALLSNRDGKVSETTVDKINTVFEILRANPKISMQTLEGLLTQIAKVGIGYSFPKLLNKTIVFIFVYSMKMYWPYTMTPATIYYKSRWA